MQKGSCNETQVRGDGQHEGELIPVLTGRRVLKEFAQEELRIGHEIKWGIWE